MRNIQFQNFPLEQFADAGKVANDGDPHLKAAADKELYELEKCAIKIDTNVQTDDEIMTDTNGDSPDDIVSHMQEKVSQQNSCDHDDNILRNSVWTNIGVKKPHIYGPFLLVFTEPVYRVNSNKTTDIYQEREQIDTTLCLLNKLGK